MTIGIGGWGSRRKPMSLVRAILRTDLTDLTIVSYGGPDVGLLCAPARSRKLIVTRSSSLALDPASSRTSGPPARPAPSRGIELDEGMFLLGPPGRGLAGAVPADARRARLRRADLINPGSADGHLALRRRRGARRRCRRSTSTPRWCHLNRADAARQRQYLGPDPYFDDLLLAAPPSAASCRVEQIVDTDELAVAAGRSTRLLISRLMVDGVVETPNGAHFTDVHARLRARRGVPEGLRRHRQGSDEAWAAFRRAAGSILERGRLPGRPSPPDPRRTPR